MVASSRYIAFEVKEILHIFLSISYRCARSGERKKKKGNRPSFRAFRVMVAYTIGPRIYGEPMKRVEAATDLFSTFNRNGKLCTIEQRRYIVIDAAIGF